MAYDTKYGFEIWSPGGSLLADLSGLARSRSFSITRNGAEDIQFSVDLDAFEAFCRAASIGVGTLLVPNVNEVRIRRGGSYMIGGQISYIMPKLEAGGATLEFKVTGFLNLFKDRYTPVMQNYNSIEASVIATSLISDSQTGGNLIANATFETNLTGWSSSGAVITRTADQAYSGIYSMKVEYSSAGQYASYGYATFDTTLSYQGGAWVLVPFGKQVAINITFTGGAGVTQITYTGTGAWQFITTNSQTAGTISGQMQIVSITAGAFIIYVDQTILAVSDTIISPVVDNVNILDFGITVGSITNVGTHVRNYQRANIKDALIALTEVQTNPLDFEFTYDKKFNTYASIGTTRSDIVFEYPNNINEASYSIDGSNMGNQIIGIGQGNGDITQLVLSGVDNTSLKTYKLRQKIFNSSATDNSDNGLTDGIATELSKWANPVRLLDITVDGNQAPYVTDYKIGDRVRININGYASFVDASGVYRIEQINVTLDDEDNETVRLVVS